MGRVIKGCFGLFIVAGAGVIGVSLWGMHQISAYEAMSPAQRAEIDRQVEERAEADRRERLRGTDCENLDALACYDMRRQRKNREAAAEAWEKSDLKQAYDDAGVR